jgi:hypothetical protein
MTFKCIEEVRALAEEALKEMVGLIDYLQSPEAEENARRIKAKRAERRALRNAAKKTRAENLANKEPGTRAEQGTGNPNPERGTRNQN